MWFDETGLPWVMPSPNMPTPETALVYPGTCLFEGTNVSEGRGTTRPFELIGAPWIDAEALADAFEPVWSSPGAVQTDALIVGIEVPGRGVWGCAGACGRQGDVPPVDLGLRMVERMRQLYPSEFGFLPAGASGRQMFDLLMGTDRVRLSLEMGTPVRRS